jgi:MoxR-like ATPase
MVNMMVNMMKTYGVSMDFEQRLIICCNYKALSSNDKGQAIALYEKDKDTSILSKINSDKYFSEPDDCEIHIVPNNRNEDHDYSYLEKKYENRLYLIQCIENKYIENGSTLAKNKSNLAVIEPVEPNLVCEVIESDLPDETSPEIILDRHPLTRHIFIQDSQFTYGPFEYDIVELIDENKFTLTLKKPSDAKYLGKMIQRLAIFKFTNDQLSPFIDSFEFQNKLINNQPFNHKFISNVSKLKELEFEQIDYGFMDELSKAVGIIVKETNTKGITPSQITMLSTRIKNKRNKFNFNTDYVFKQLNDSMKFEKSIVEAKKDIRDLVLEQALNENEKLKKHFTTLLKNDETIVLEVKEQIKNEQEQDLSKLKMLKMELSIANDELKNKQLEVQKAESQIKQIDEEKEKSVIEQLKLKQTELNQSITGLEEKENVLNEKYDGLFKYDELTEVLNKIKDDIRNQKFLYDSKADEVRDKKQEVKDEEKALKELTEKSAEHYKKELLSVKNSIDVLTQVDNTSDSIIFTCLDKNKLVALDSENSLCEYLKHTQVALSEHERNLSIEHVINYLVCIDTSFITILSGLPGTGKTSLVSILGESVLKSRFNHVQVGRGWSSERDLLGYFNPITNSYIPSGTGMYEFLSEVDKDERINIVLLDEANLSPIEHYWSKFMGLSDSFEGKEIKVTNCESLKINNNLRFIATINNDMTTEPLSPRLIDRAPCIRLDIYSLKDEGNKSGLDTISDEELNDLKAKYSNNAICYADFQNIIQEMDNDIDQLEKMVDVIDQLKNLLISNSVGDERFGGRIHLSERRYQVIKKYLEISLCLYENFIKNTTGWVDVNKSYYFLDFAVSQFILPLITGHGKNFKNRVVHLNNLLCSIQQIHTFELPISLELLDRMLSQGEEDLDTYDFMSLR